MSNEPEQTEEPMIQKHIINKKYGNYNVKITLNEDNLNFIIADDNNEIYIKENFKSSEKINITIIEDMMDNNKIKIQKDNKEKKKLKFILSEKERTLVELEKTSLFNYFIPQINELNNKFNKLNDEMKKKSQIMIFLIGLFLLTILILILMIIFKIFIIEKSKNKNEDFNTINEEIKFVNNNFFDFKKDIYLNIDELKNNINSFKPQYAKVMTQTNVINLFRKEQKNIYALYSISSFPNSGNIVAVSYNTIIILDKNLKIIQKIKDAHDGEINYVDVYDEYNFVTCSNDKTIKTWFKSGNDKNFTNNKTIEDPHNDYIMKVIYDSKGNLISGSYYDKIIIWELKNGTYVNITTLEHNDHINSFLLIDENTLITGDNKINIWNLTNNNKINSSNDNISISWNNCIEKIDEDKIMICNYTNLIILSIPNFKIIQIIDNIYNPIAIKSINMKGIILVSGEIYQDDEDEKYNLNIYRKDNFELRDTIEIQKKIYDFIELKNNSIISSCDDGTLHVWSSSII